MNIRHRRAKGAFALLFIVSGIGHFVRHDLYLRLMPPPLPYPRELVYISGVIEGGLGILLLWPRTQRLAAWGLMATLVAIYPANIYAALSAGTPHEAMRGVPVWAAWLRLPLQFVLLAWAYAYTRPAPTGR